MVEYYPARQFSWFQVKDANLRCGSSAKKWGYRHIAKDHYGKKGFLDESDLYSIRYVLSTAPRVRVFDPRPNKEHDSYGAQMTCAVVERRSGLKIGEVIRFSVVVIVNNKTGNVVSSYIRGKDPLSLGYRLDKDLGIPCSPTGTL